MANSNTDHSKKLRQATATKARREKLKSGEISQITITMPTERMNYVKQVLESIDKSRPQALYQLCKIYDESN